MPQIHVLPRHLVNKIAAGEVIERPASVLKELLENAIDSGATRIAITVEDGGRKLISVSDDGGGMSDEDLALAFAPHATSKIAGEDDLERIETMGFRGEALASIASISHAHIRTRRADETSGCEVEVSGETIGEVRPCAAAAGTTATVRNLFFNTPARRKFMRTTNTEFGHVVEQLTRLALPHPQVTFTLTHNGREAMNLPATEATIGRAADIFGASLAEALLPIARRGGKVDVAGLIAPPAAARSSGKWQYFFLNGRYVRDRLLAHALREAYRGLVEPSRWPPALVFLELDPAEVDVNVHPTKIEVRFRDGQLVHGELLAALRDTLNKANLTPTASLKSAMNASVDATASQDAEKRRESLRRAMADFFKSVPPAQPRFSFPETPSHRQHAPITPPARSTGDGTSPTEGPAPPASTHAPPRAIQIQDSYIAAACDDGLLIVDQHALHERIIYNDLRRRLTGSEASPLTGQRLLIPETLRVTPAEAAALENFSELLGRLGIETTPFGPDAVAIQQFPTLLGRRGVTPGEFLRDVLDKLIEDETAGDEHILQELLAMTACKAAVKAGQKLTTAEIDELLARREEAQGASACPHGRPTTLKLTVKDLQKQFKRT